MMQQLQLELVLDYDLDIKYYPIKIKEVKQEVNDRIFNIAKGAVKEMWQI